MTGCLSKLTRAIPVAKVTTLHVAAVFLENLVMVFGVPKIILMGNGKEFTSKFYAGLRSSTGTKLVIMTEHHLKTDRQVER